MSNVTTFEPINLQKTLHGTGEIKKTVENNLNVKADSRGIVSEIVKELFDGVFYKNYTREICENTDESSHRQTIVAGDTVSNNPRFYSKVVACVHTFDKETPIKKEPHKYISGEPILLGYHNQNLKDSRIIDENFCDIYDYSTTFNVRRDCIPSNMAGEVNVERGTISTIQKVFERSNFGFQNPSVSGLTNVTNSQELFLGDDDVDYLDEKESESLGTLEQKSDIIDLVNNQSMRSVASTSANTKVDQEEWESTEESLIQVIELECVSSPPFGQIIETVKGASEVQDDSDKSGVEFLLPKFDEENMDVIDLNDHEVAQGGKGDDFLDLTAHQGSNDTKNENFISPDTEENCSSVTKAVKKEATLSKRKKWNIASRLRSFFSRKCNKNKSDDSLNN